MDDFVKPTGGEVILENRPVGESQSNGFVSGQEIKTSAGIK